MSDPSRIAVIGSGISGMAAAWLLGQRHDVTLFEREDYIGGHTRTKQVRWQNRDIPVDTGFIVFNHRNYPELTGLFRHLGVATQPSTMTFAISANDGEMEWSAASPNALFGQRRNLARPRFYAMLLDVMRFFRQSPGVLDSHTQMTLGELLTRLGTGEWFKRYFLLPMGGAIWSCPVKTMLDFPAETFVRFFENHGLLTINDQPQWRTVTGGSQAYVQKLLAGLRGAVRTCAPARKIRRTSSGVAIIGEGAEEQTFDQVVLACHADEALALLEQPSATEAEILGAFRYQSNEAWLHSDPRFMPKRRRCWASWVYLSNARADTSDEADLSVTYWMNALQNLDPACPLFVTLNPAHPVRDDLVHDRHSFTHPVFTREAIAAQARIPEIQGADKIWYCGAYQRYGFHEDGLMSAVAVASRMGCPAPWH